MDSATTIDLSRDQLITLSEACRLLPSKPSPATLWRWRHHGIHIAGRCIKLATVRVGGQHFTTIAAFAAFLRQQNESAPARPDDEPGARTEDQARRLAAAGLI